MCAFCGLAAAQTVPSFTISTIAGTGTAGYSGDGGSPTAAEFSLPFGIAIASGNLYIADQVNNRARYVTNGNTTTLAGDGAAGYSGDSAAGNKAELNAPTGVTVDKNGNLYIADTLNQVVRMVNTAGTINTFAGNNSLGPGYSGDGDSAVNGQMNAPAGMAFDASGNLYIADSSNCVIRLVTNGVFSTFAGNTIPDFGGDGGPATQAQLFVPTALAFDSAGNLYIADTMNNRIRIVTTDGNINTFAGTGQGGYSGDGGPAVNAQLFHPSGIAIDSKGNVYIADSFNNVIRVVLPSGTIATVAGTGASGYSGDGGVATGAQLNFPTGLAIDASGNLVVADTNNSVIRQLTPNGTTTFVAGPSITAAYSLQAYGGSTSIAPGSWIEIHGSNLAVDSRQWNNSDFNGNTAPTSLDGTKVNLGAQSLYVEFIGQSQVNALVPSTMGSGPQLLTVTTPSGKSAPFPITVNTVQPGLLAPSSFNVNGTQYVVALFQDGITYVLPPNAIAGVTSRPAKAGDNITLYGIGLGPVTPNVSAGQITANVNQTDLPATVLFGQAQANVTYAGLEPGTVGLYQINVVVPNVSGNAIPLTFTVGSVSGTQKLYIPVQ